MFETDEDIDVSLVESFLDGVKPDPVITVSQWADEKRVLPQTSAEPGRFKTDRTPYAREIMDKLSVNDPAQKIIVEKGSQLGFTEIGNNWVGYCIDVAPAPFMFIMPTDAMMKKTSKQRIEKMIEATPELKNKVPKSKGKEGGNTLLYKEYPGGFVTMIGANSPVGLSSTAIRNVYGDEIDRYPESVGNEGAAVDLAETRTVTFGSRKKIFLTSTPTMAGTSQIHIEFEKTGRRYYHVPCPFCSHYQVLDFYCLKYEKDNYEDVKYQCCECGQLIEEYHKTNMLAAGEWVPKFPEKEDGYTFGYHISAMYSPYGMYSWSKMAKDYEDAQGNTPKMVVFTNTKLGICYEAVEAEKPDWQNIFDRAEDYEQEQPFVSVAFLTAGVDVQKDRLQIEVVGWMKGKTSQSIAYMQLVGDTSQDDVWDQLAEIIEKPFIRQGDGAAMPIRLTAIDTGYNTERVYKFTKKYSIQRVVPIKGNASLDMYFSVPKAVEVVKAGKKLGKVKVWHVGVSMLKSEIYGLVKKRIDLETGVIPNGYCHFPKRDQTYFRGLIGEELQQVISKKGFEGYQWVKTYKRNEPLDCRVYAQAAAYMVGMDRWKDEQWEKAMTNYEVQVKPQSNLENKIKKRRRSSFWDR